MSCINLEQFINERSEAILTASNRLVHRSKTKTLLRIHPTEKTIRYTSFLQNNKLLTPGQIAFERIKEAGSLINYIIYNCAQDYFSRHEPDEIKTLWMAFRESVNARGIDVYHAWKSNFLNTKFQLLIHILYKHDVHNIIKCQFSRYVQSVVALGLVPYQITEDTVHDIKIPPVQATLVHNNNFTECSSSTKARLYVDELIGRKVEIIRNKIANLDEIIIAVNPINREYYCDPVYRQGGISYKIYPSEEPCLHNMTEGYSLNSICAKLDNSITFVLDLQNMYKQAIVHGTTPYRALICPENITDDIIKRTNAHHDDDDDINHATTNFLINIHKKGVKDPQSIVKDLVGGKFKRTFDDVDETTTVKKTPLLEKMGYDVADRSRTEFAHRLFTNKMTEPKDGKNNKMFEYVSQEYQKCIKQNKTFYKCISGLSLVNNKISRENDLLLSRVDALKDQLQTTTTSKSDLFNLDDRDVHKKSDTSLSMIPPGYKVMNSSVTPQMPDIEQFTKMVSDLWMAMLRDVICFIPEYNHTGDKIDEKPTQRTEAYLYKPFLTLLGFDVEGVVDFDEPLAIKSARDIFNRIFEESICGKIMQVVEAEENGWSRNISEALENNQNSTHQTSRR